jgi:DNA-binding transcriptional ArsR family regulator
LIEQETLRRMMAVRYSPLLDMALSLLVLHAPERFGDQPWAERLRRRLPAGALEQLRAEAERTDLFALAMELDREGQRTAPDALHRYARSEPLLGPLLITYWEALSPELGASAGLLADSVQAESARLRQMDPLSFICGFSDRVSVAGDGEAIVLHWGKGMRVPLQELSQILFVPSAFCPRRLMFYRLGPVQIFFYAPLSAEPGPDAEAPESVLLGLSALADSTRLRLLQLIARESMPAQEMARRLGLNESTVSRHLKQLTEAELVGRERQEGKFIYYSLQVEHIDLLVAGLNRYLGRNETDA